LGKPHLGNGGCLFIPPKNVVGFYQEVVFVKKHDKNVGVFYPLSSILYPLSSILYPLSSILYPLSSILYPLSSMKTQWIFLCLLLCAASAFGQFQPGGLRCESKPQTEKLLVVESQHPRLGWSLEGDMRGIYQTAYQILVASDEKFEKVLWDSGKVVSEQSVSVEYAGKPLRSRQECFWKVRVWDNEGNESHWSDTAKWEMALLEQSDWKAKWINDGKPTPTNEADFFKDDPAPVFVKGFQVEKPVKKARLYITGLGFYQAALGYYNVKILNETGLNPGWTDYGKRVLYDVYDVSGDLCGRNYLAITLGNGWYNPLPLRFWGKWNLREHLTVGRPRAIAQLEIEYEDGTTEMIVTDESWETMESNVIRNNVYLGEVHDLRDTKSEMKSVSIAEEPIGPLRLQMQPKIEDIAPIFPVAITQPKPGVYILDMGRNFSGRLYANIKGKPGDRVKFRFGELLYPDGTLNVMTSVAGQIKTGKENIDGEYPKLAYQSDTIFLKEGENSFNVPLFTWHVFRYVEITGLDKNPDLGNFLGVVCAPDFASENSFVCSNDRFNEIQKMCVNTFLSNLFSVQSDCPGRERFGYGGDIVPTCDALMLNFEMESFYRKVAQDFADAARPNGGLTEVAPHVGLHDDGLGGESGPIGWQIAFPMLIEKLYQYYGDLQTMREMYPVVKKQLEFVRSCAKEHLIDRCISDHESLDPKPVALMATAHYFYLAQAVAGFAEKLGYESDAKEYRTLADQIEKAFVKKFYDPATGKFDIGTQATQSCALHFGLLPKDADGRIDEAEKAKILAVLESEMSRHKGHIAAGIFGTRYLLETLSREMAPKLAYQMVDAEGFPGWRHMLDLGATTLWEHWEFSDNTYSHNHPMFGSVSAWFYEDVAGIRPEKDAVGFNRFIVAPKITDDLSWAEAEYDSVHGLVQSGWKRDDDGTYTLKITVPYNTTATVCLPAKDFESVRENGRPIDAYAEIQRLEQENGQVTLQVRGGTYSFTWE